MSREFDASGVCLPGGHAAEKAVDVLIAAPEQFARGEVGAIARAAEDRDVFVSSPGQLGRDKLIQRQWRARE